MKRAWAPYALIGLVLYCVFLFAFAPAAWVVWGVTRISGGALAISDAEGTFWSGDGTLTVSGTRRDLGRLRWRINPTWLFAGQISTRVELSDSETTLSAKLRAGFGGVRVRDAVARFSPAAAAVFYPPLSLAEPTGSVELRADDLSLSRNSINGDAKLFWRGAGVNMTDVRPLGDYELRLSGKDRTIIMTLLTHAGPLDLAGKGSWLPFDGGRLEFSGAARATGQQAGLAPLLTLLGARTGSEARLLIRTAFVLR